MLLLLLEVDLRFEPSLWHGCQFLVRSNLVMWRLNFYLNLIQWCGSQIWI